MFFSTPILNLSIHSDDTMFRRQTTPSFSYAATSSAERVLEGHFSEGFFHCCFAEGFCTKFTEGFFYLCFMEGFFHCCFAEGFCRGVFSLLFCRGVLAGHFAEGFFHYGFV